MSSVSIWQVAWHFNLCAMSVLVQQGPHGHKLGARLEPEIPIPRLLPLGRPRQKGSPSGLDSNQNGSETKTSKNKDTSSGAFGNSGGSPCICCALDPFHPMPYGFAVPFRSVCSMLLSSHAHPQQELSSELLDASGNYDCMRYLKHIHDTPRPNVWQDSIAAPPIIKMSF